MDELNNNKKIILVIGMHRSGTSLMCQCLEALGVCFGDGLIDPGFDNPQGFVEDGEIINLNKEIFRLIGVDDDGTLEKMPADWRQVNDVESFKEKIKDKIYNTFLKDNPNQVFGFKDPRITLLLPLYLEALKELKVDFKVILMRRSFLDIAHSLNKRDGIDVLHAYKIAEDYIIKAKYYLKGIDYREINFNDLVNDTVGTLNKIKDFLPKEISDGISKNKSLSKVSNEDLRHHSVAREDYVVSLLKEIKTQEEKHRIYKNEIEEKVSRLEQEKERMVEITSRFSQELPSIKKLEASITERDGKIKKLEADITEKYNEIKKLQNENGHFYSLIAEKDNEIKDLHTTINSIERSTVWKMLKSWDIFVSLIFLKNEFLIRQYRKMISGIQNLTNDVFPSKIIHGLKNRESLGEAKKFWNAFFAKNKKIDVLFVNHEESRTGAPRIIFDIAQYYKKKSNVAVVSLRGGTMSKDFKSEFKTIIYPDEIYPDLDPDTQAEKIIKKINPKLVYVNSISTFRYAKKAKELGIKTIFHIHELEIAFQVFFTKKQRKDFKNYADKYIAVSQPVYDLLVYKLGCDPEKVILQHAFVNRERILGQSNEIDQSIVKKELRIAEDQLVVMGIGYFIYRKGADIFMKTAKQMIDKGHNVKFIWIGGTPFKEPIMGNMQKYNEYFSLVSEKENPFPYLKSADLFLLPSRDDPFPLVTLEALTLNKPVIVFKNSGGIHKAVKEGGTVVEKINEKDFFDAVEDLIKNNEKREKMSKKAPKSQEPYDSKDSLEAISDIIEKTKNG